MGVEENCIRQTNPVIGIVVIATATKAASMVIIHLKWGDSCTSTMNLKQRLPYRVIVTGVEIPLQYLPIFRQNQALVTTRIRII